MQPATHAVASPSHDTPPGERVRHRGVSPSPLARATIVRRRAVAVAVLLLATFLLTVAIGRVGAEAELADPVAGHAVIEPGQTLWGVAVDTAPANVDPREQLRAIQDLNGLASADVEAWTVVLLPAR